jgi:hypothetical protein
MISASAFSGMTSSIPTTSGRATHPAIITRARLEAIAIRKDFDRVFDPLRCLDTHVRRQVNITRENKNELLTVLDHPYATAENNGQERGAKARVGK